jgi:hydroxyethylthiazole kinase-like uncharacterized protein yjeF
MKILTATQMARLDRQSIRRFKIPAKRLMGRAAQACVDVLLERTPRRMPGKVVLVCGPGNNGGDGFAMAQILRQAGVAVECYFLGKAEKLSPEATYYFHQLKPAATVLKGTRSDLALKRDLKKADWVVDALFGTGLNRSLKGRYAQVLQWMNAAKAHKLAVDMPSGVSGESGQVLGIAFRAQITVTFEVPKWGQVQPSAWDYVGDLEVRPIGLSKKALGAINSQAQWLHPSMLKPWFKSRTRNWNKGKGGKVLIVAGSASMPGAGYLSALGALRSGAGLVTWALPEEIQGRMKLKYPEVILRFLTSKGGKFSSCSLPELLDYGKGFQALAVGPGWGQGGELPEFLLGILKENPQPKVIDADALNLLAKHPSLLKHVAGSILTPHPKEMSRLVKMDVKDLMAKRIQVGQAFSKKHGVWLLIKSYRSVVTGPKGEVFINSVGGPNLAVAGSGDVLTGILAALLAQGFNAKRAVLAGIYLHGRAGDRLAAKLGDRGSLASEVAAQVPHVIQELLS